MTKRKRHAAIYARVSTDEQAERGTSLEDQVLRTAGYCEEQGWRVADEYIDEGVSGATLERPALQRLLADARAGSFETVVVTDPDRLSRDLVDGLVVERELTRLAVDVVYMIQPTMGTLERQLRGVIAEEERRKIRDRTSRGLRSVAMAGYWPGGPPPYGYRISKDHRTGRSRLEIEPSEAETLKWMIEALVDQGMTTWEVASALNARGVSTPATSRKTANTGSPRWDHRRVRDLLSTARAIAGHWTYRTSAGNVHLEIPAIVPEARLEQLRARLQLTSTGKGATLRKNAYLLAGRVESPCGSTMHGMAKPDGSNRVYVCSQRSASRGPDRCDCARVSADALEEAVWQSVHEMLTEPERLLALAGLVAQDSKGDATDDLARVDRRIQRLEKALGSQIADLLATGIDASAVSKAAKQLEDELVELRRQRQRVVGWETARSDYASRADRIQRLAESAQERLDDPDVDLKRATLAILDVTAKVTGQTTCPMCDGRGLLPRSGDRVLHRTRTGDICPSCSRYKSIPTVEIFGLLPDIDTLPTDIVGERAEDSVPFTLHLTA